MTLRRATEIDIPSMMRIERASSLHPWTESAFYNEFTNPYSHLWILEEEGAALGYVCVWFIHEDGQIVNVVVLPEYRGCGLGKTLIEHVIDEAKTRGIRSLSLEVRRSNQTALALYRNFGFQEVSVRTRYYENGEDALLMVRLITTEY